MTTLKRKKTPIHVDFNDLYSRIYPRKNAVLDVDTVKHDDVAPGEDTTVKFIQTDGGMLIIRSDDEVEDGD